MAHSFIELDKAMVRVISLISFCECDLHSVGPLMEKIRDKVQRCGPAMDCCRGSDSGCSRSGYGISPLDEVAINPTIELPELTQDSGNRLLEGTNKTLCTPGPRRKEQ